MSGAIEGELLEDVLVDAHGFLYLFRACEQMLILIFLFFCFLSEAGVAIVLLLELLVIVFDHDLLIKTVPDS